jgi:glycine dehydrogenase
VLAGLRVAVVRCGADGAVDLGDLRARLAEHAGRVAAIMVTYPSTNGVYEETITTVADLVHEAGGQVYIDGANLNALAGVASPALLGGDVSHLNLHKTFCIPHGGGGPGVGPVVARSHLAPFLPARLGGQDGPGGGGLESQGGPVAAARFGSAGVLPISWAYIALMGAAGLRRATQVAVLSANYVARRLAPHFPVVYSGRDGLVAHECIVDLRQLPGGVTVEDVAKRLIDYGFHAPTMSFPVAGTFMIEPTESESLAELDAFCDALIAVRAEVDKVGSGAWDRADNPLKNAPHTAEMLMASEWSHAYPREDGGFPGGPGTRGLAGGRAKYWPPVRRIDSAYGDRNLVCACPPPEAFV